MEHEEYSSGKDKKSGLRHQTHRCSLGKTPKNQDSDIEHEDMPLEKPQKIRLETLNISMFPWERQKSGIETLNMQIFPWKNPQKIGIQTLKTRMFPCGGKNLGFRH